MVGVGISCDEYMCFLEQSFFRYSSGRIQHLNIFLWNTSTSLQDWVCVGGGGALSCVCKASNAIHYTKSKILEV